MKTFLLAVATLASAVCTTASAQQTADKLKPGDKMPGAEVNMPNANGEPTTLQKSVGQNGILVMFSCNTCPFVVRNQAMTKRTMAYCKAHGIGMVVLNSNEAQRDAADAYEAMQKYAKEQGYTVPYLVDNNSKLADMYGANHTPEIFLFDSKGRLVYKGAMNDNPGDPSAFKHVYIEEAINAMIAGKTPDPQETRSVGCSIKRRS